MHNAAARRASDFVRLQNRSGILKRFQIVPGRSRAFGKAKRKAPALKEGGEASRGSWGNRVLDYGFHLIKTLEVAAILLFFREKINLVSFSRLPRLFIAVTTYFCQKKKGPCLKED
ncbi:MAG: hypothetical protein CEE38_08690 [Planctomycetes bacterium B3_Pla]|nr:MAG: hypothetical protein CEE38_08690 [Planctomycetes bacterium B3_Pla]